MGSDSTFGLPGSISPAVADQLCGALDRYAERWRDGETPELRIALTHVADAVHGAGLGPEKMISAVKRCWASVPAEQRSDEYLMRIALSGVVDFCIEAYYRDHVRR